MGRLLLYKFIQWNYGPNIDEIWYRGEYTTSCEAWFIFVQSSRLNANI